MCVVCDVYHSVIYVCTLCKGQWHVKRRSVLLVIPSAGIVATFYA